MHGILRRCGNCGVEMQSVRRTKIYCSDACRKKAARGETDLDRKTASRWMIEHLLGLGLIGKIWPVYSWDQSPAIFSLVTTVQNALDELNAVALVSESEFSCAMKCWNIESSDGGTRLQAAIKAFYDARKDRRIREGYNPLRQGQRWPLILLHFFHAYADILTSRAVEYSFPRSIRLSSD
jgi:hypothetical protein